MLFIKRKFPKKNSTLKNSFNKSKKKHSIWYKLLLNFIILVSVSLLTSGIVTYVNSKKTFEKNFKNSSMDILNQVKSNIELLTNYAKGSTWQILSNQDISIIEKSFSDGDAFENMKKQKNLESFLNGVIYSSIGGSIDKSLITSIYLIDLDGNIGITATGSYGTLNTKFCAKDETWFKDSIENQGTVKWLPPHEDSFNNEKSQVISVVSPLKQTQTGQLLGCLKINFDVDKMFASLHNTHIGEEGYIFILDENDFIIFHKDKNLIGKKLSPEILKSLPKNEKEFYFKSNKKTMYGISVDVPITSSNTWRFIAAIPKSEISASSNKMGLITLAVTLLMILLSAVISSIIAKYFTKSINDFIVGTKELSSGNFNVELKGNNLQEFDTLSKNFNKMTSELRELFSSTAKLSLETSEASSTLLNLSSNLNFSAKEILNASSQIAEGSSKQTETAMVCVDLSEDFNKELSKAVESLNGVRQATENSNSVINSNSKVILSLKESSIHNKEVIQSLSHTISTLNNNTKDILNILSKLKSITEQTNLLSLNASIEAARAGEQGRGFSVVADEIRKLADESKKSSEEIKSILDNVSESIKTSLLISKDAEKSFNDETFIVSKTIDSFTDINNSISSILSLMEKTNESIATIDVGKDILNDYVNKIAAISQSNTSATEEVSASIESQNVNNSSLFELSSKLNEKAQTLNSSINKFKY